MIPVSNGTSSPCSPISSNCVIWQGPDIPCIGICNGDTVSDVVGKLGEELCQLINASCECNPDISGLDLKCLPENTELELEPVLQAIIDYICELNPGESGSLPNVTLPACLRYNDNIGNPVTQLPLDQFAELLGNRICNILSTINSIQLAITDLQSRVTILENCVLPCEAQPSGEIRVISSCLFPGTLVPVSQLLLALENRFCAFVNAVGGVSLVNQAISAQCIFGNTQRLSGVGTYGGLTGWINSPTSLSQSHVDQWLVICDLYAAVKDIQDNCCEKGCGGVIFGVSYTTIDGNGDNVVDSLNLNFTSSTIPVGFNDCGGSTVITITDSNGTSITQNVNVSSLASNPIGVNVNLTGLNTLSSLVMSVPFCVTDGTSQCADKQTIIIPLNIPCPTTINASALLTDITVSFTNALGTGVTYTIVAIDTLTGATLGTTSITTPPVSILHTFSGAIPGRVYNIIVTVSQGSSVKTCPPVSVSVPGNTCSNVYITDTTNTPGASDIYLGAERPGGGSDLDYWYNPVTQEIVVGTLLPVACDSPTASAYTIDTFGNISITFAYGTTGGTSIEISYGADGINWAGTTNVVPGPTIVATGITSGSAYLRARVNCGSGFSEYLILRYDFGTGAWIILADPAITSCLNTSISGVCPMGVEVATQTLNCDGISYNVFGGGVNSKWYYVGKYVRSGNTVYIYAGWKDSYSSGTAASVILECCVCPAFIATDTIQVFCQENNSVMFRVPYILGNGTPNMTLTSPAAFGTVVQSSPTSNEFTYTNTINSYGDTFGVSLAPSVAGVCSQTVATIQIQIIPCDVKLNFLNQPIYAFIDTGSYSFSEGADIKNGLLSQITTWGLNFGYTGSLYFIPVSDNRYLGYQKSIVDSGATAILDADPNWVALRQLPPSWTGGPEYKDGVFMIAFVNTAATNYHAATFVSGFSGQLTSVYQDDYDAFIDALTGTQTSTWAQALGITIPQYPDGFSAVLYPFTVKNSGASDAALVLQGMAAYTGEMIPPVKYGIKTVVDVTGYLLQGLVPSASNPYNGFVTAGGNVVSGLFNQGWLAYFNNIEKTGTYTDISNNISAQFIQQLDLAIENCNGTYPSTSISATGYKLLICQTGEIKNVEWLDITVPNIGETWSFDDPIAGPLCGKVVSNQQIFSSVFYSTGPNPTGLLSGCEECGTIWLIEDCATGDQYTINAASWTATSLTPGNIFKVQNTGASFNPIDGRAPWLIGEEKCVILLNLVTSLPEVDPTIESTIYVECAICLASL